MTIHEQTRAADDHCANDDYADDHYRINANNHINVSSQAITKVLLQSATERKMYQHLTKDERNTTRIKSASMEQ